MESAPVPARRLAVAALVAIAALAAGCAPKTGQEQAGKAPLTEHQRDSILATEPIPGAPAVGAALDATAKEAKRAAEMDSTLR